MLGDRTVEGSCEILSVEIGESPVSRFIEMGDVGIDRFRLAAAAYRSEFLIGDALHDALCELWTLAREFFRPSFDQYARGASIAMRAGRGLEWLHLLKAMLGSRGQLREVRDRDGTTLAQLHGERRLWGAPADYFTLGVVMDTGPLPMDGPYADEEARHAAAQWGAELRELGHLVSRCDSPASALAVSFHWGRTGDPWDPATLAAFARRDVILVAHAPALRGREFIIEPVGAWLQVRGSKRSLQVRGLELMERLRGGSASHGLRQVDLSTCDSRRLIEASAIPPAMLVLGLGGLTQRGRLYRGVHELITGLRTTHILGRPFAFLGPEAPAFPTARVLVRAVMLEEIYGELARDPHRPDSCRASAANDHLYGRQDVSTHDKARAFLADIHIRPTEAARLRDTLEHLMNDVPPLDKTSRALRLSILEWYRSLHDVSEEGCSLAELQERVLEGLMPIQTTAGSHTFDPDGVWNQISHFIDALLQRARASTEATAFATGVVAAHAIDLDSGAGSAFVTAMIAVICMSIWKQPTSSPDIEPATQRPPTAKHTILFLAANPSGTDRRALDQEVRAIQAELERSGFRDRFALMTRWATEPLDLLRELRKLRPTVVHFSGHGAQDAPGVHGSSLAPSHDVAGATGQAGSERRHGLFFQGPDNRPQLVSTAALERTFSAAGASVKLVVLSACYSEMQARALLPHVGCVVGMSGELRDDAARSFAIGFYGALGDRESVAVAYKHGCAAIHLQGIHDSDLPRLAVREDVEASELVLAADT
ncbi:MAG: CHAT domain-containing protein [Deltaproteobacteria bacterium]|nr:MAG: CHAT domain-containing protein [Deltaproteobacteria bacterium]